jgi:histidine ammonia-lyase
MQLSDTESKRQTRNARNKTRALFDDIVSEGLMRHAVTGFVAVALFSIGGSVQAASYTTITPSKAGEVVTLTGHDLTIEQVVDVARCGAKVKLAPEAKQRELDNYGLLLEGAAEGVSIYWFNRGAGSNREVVMFQGDPMSLENKAYLEKSQLAEFQNGLEGGGYGPEIDREEVVRAMMVVRANAMIYDAPSPGLADMLIDFINKRITPVARVYGSTGEGDLAVMGNIGSVMVGLGDAYYQGQRMPGAEALRKAGLKTLVPFGADQNALTSSNAYATGQAALLVADAREAMEWTELIYAVDLNALNSSITPLAAPVQLNRPQKWLNWHAARMLNMLKGSYLFDGDARRIIQDPESMRASSIREGSVWQAWAQLRDGVLFQLNSSDHNPAVRVGLSPGDAWELKTPQLMKYYVKGGKYSNGKHGYIVSNANWDPYPLSNELEFFTLALANSDIAVELRIDRFGNPFFTQVKPGDVLTPEQLARVPTPDSAFSVVDVWQEIQGLAMPVAPAGNGIVSTVEDLQTNSRLKVTRARRAVDLTMLLLGQDLLTGAYWLDIRKAQDPSRNFGVAATAVWSAFRKVFPFQRESGAPQEASVGAAAEAFILGNPAATFFPPARDLPETGGETTAIAGR